MTKLEMQCMSHVFIQIFYSKNKRNIKITLVPRQKNVLHFHLFIYLFICIFLSHSILILLLFDCHFLINKNGGGGGKGKHKFNLHILQQHSSRL